MMTTLKKFSALILALGMLFILSFPSIAHAADTGGSNHFEINVVENKDSKSGAEIADLTIKNISGKTAKNLTLVVDLPMIFQQKNGKKITVNLKTLKVGETFTQAISRKSDGLPTTGAANTTTKTSTPLPTTGEKITSVLMLLGLGVLAAVFIIFIKHRKAVKHLLALALLVAGLGSATVVRAADTYRHREEVNHAVELSGTTYVFHLVAESDFETYTVTFDSNGGSDVAPATDLAEGTTVKQPSNPSKTGYTFAGWYTQSDFSGTAWNFATDKISAKDTTLYAKWTVNSYTVTFDSHDGSVVPSATTDFGDFVVEPDAPTKTGYTFAGWFTASDVTGSAWDFTTYEMPAHDITLYAHWTANQYGITYDLAGGVNDSSNPSSYTYGTGVANFAPATKTGYTFVGWFDAASGGNAITEITTTDIEAKTLYAHWTANQYGITYYLAGGTNDSSNPSSYTYGTGVTSFAPATKTGYTFAGWFDAATGGNAIIEITTTDIEAKTLYAHWTANQYGITYDLAGGTNDSSNPSSYTYGTGVTSFAPAIKTGYTFVGWFDAASGGNEITEITTTDIENKTLYAHWTANQYGIAYELDGGTNAISNPSSYTYGTGVTSFAPATKTGYTFVGWFDAPSGGNEITAIFTTSTGAKTLYAKWEITYTVTYDSNGGSTVNPEMVTAGTTVTSPTPTKDDATDNDLFAGEPAHDFDLGGWYTDTALTQAFDFSTPITGDITLYAKWDLPLSKGTITNNFLGDQGDRVWFANAWWRILKTDMDTMLPGNQALVLQEKAITAQETGDNDFYVKFHNTSLTYFLDGTTSTGYGESHLKYVIDCYYANKINGSDYENYVQAVSLNNPIFSAFASSPAFTGNGNTYDQWWWGDWYTDTRFATSLGGSKQAFALSYGDIQTLDKSTFNDTGYYSTLLDFQTVGALDSFFWLRSAGDYFGRAGVVVNGDIYNSRVDVKGSFPVHAALSIQLD